jgi:hypothetical protein
MPAPKDRKRSAALRAVTDVLRAYVAAFLKKFKPPAQSMRDVETRLSSEPPPGDDAMAAARNSKIETP